MLVFHEGIQPSNVGIVVKHYKDLSKTSSIMESKAFFFRGSTMLT